MAARRSIARRDLRRGLLRFGYLVALVPWLGACSTTVFYNDPGAPNLRFRAMSNGRFLTYTSIQLDIHHVTADCRAEYVGSHNVWAPPSGVMSSNPGAVNYVSPTLGVLGPYNYLTGQQWNALPNVQDDQFRAVTLGSGLDLQVPIDGQMAGAILPPPLS